MPLPPRLSAAARATDAWLSRYPGRLIFRATLALVILVPCGLLLWRTTPRYEYRHVVGAQWVRLDRLGGPPVQGWITVDGFTTVRPRY